MTGSDRTAHNLRFPFKTSVDLLMNALILRKFGQAIHITQYNVIYMYVLVGGTYKPIATTPLYSPFTLRIHLILNQTGSISRTPHQLIPLHNILFIYSFHTTQELRLYSVLSSRMHLPFTKASPMFLWMKSCESISSLFIKSTPEYRTKACHTCITYTNFCLYSYCWYIIIYSTYTKLHVSSVPLVYKYKHSLPT